MGCDFELQIQVFFHDKWLPVAFFGTATRCGGFPLGNATRILYKQKGIKGDYHRNDQDAFNYEDTMNHLGFPPDAKSGVPFLRFRGKFVRRRRRGS
jgi:hypothetical protein